MNINLNKGPAPAISIPIIDLGGHVSYSLEMRAYLARLPKDRAERIVREIEYRARPRRVIDWEEVRRRQMTPLNKANDL
jgi:hypothetical protein